MSKILYWMFLILLFSCTSDREKTTPNEAEIFQRASHFYNKENFEKSLKCFDSLISINPLNGEYYFKRGYSKSMLLDDKGAVNDYKAAIKYNYNKKKFAFLNIGTLYRAYGQYDTAIYFYDKAIEIDSTYKKAKEEKEETLKIMKDMKVLYNH